MGNTLSKMALFVTVVDSGSFSKAAEKLDSTVSTVSRNIAELEAHLGVQILNRTTRKQVLTEAGQVYYQHCSQMLCEAEKAELAVQMLQDEPRGKLRVLTPYSFDGEFASNLLRDFIVEYPRINLEIIISASEVDLIEEQFDLAFIPGELKDSSMLSRGFGTAQIIYCVSPGYIEQYGSPTMNNLQDHYFIDHSYPSWLNIPNQKWEKGMKTRLKTNDLYITKTCMLSGMGIGRLHIDFVATELEQGKLIHVLPSEDIITPLNILFPNGRQLSPKVRAYLDHSLEYVKQNNAMNLRRGR